MTEQNETIVHGVDVGGCKDLTVKGFCNCDSKTSCEMYCKDNPYCNYKQLQRKIEECEKIKNDNDFADEVMQRKFNKIKNKLQIATNALKDITSILKITQQAIERIKE